MKKYIVGIALILGLLIGISVLLYPTVSDYFNAKSQSRAVAQYVDDVTNMGEDNAKAQLAAAQAYNKNLLSNPDRFEFTAKDTAEYDKQLNTGSGVMGVLVIDKIGVKLSIYHGTTQGVLQVGAGHMQGTSLPVGGIGTHSFISGHRGVPSETLLTNLDKMAMGDTFELYVMGETLTYQVDQIKTVLPDDMNELDIDPNMDYCTLVTCTPYGINDHRLLVRGHRVANAPNSGWASINADGSLLDKPVLLLIFIIPVLAALLIYAVLKCRKIHKGGIVQ